MSEAEIMDITREAIFTMVKICTPVLFTAMLIGFLISLMQTLTQIQEMTLAFVPKIIAVFISIIVFLPFMMNQITQFAQHMFDRISALGQ